MNNKSLYNQTVDPRTQCYTVKSGTLSVGLTHESVGPEYIALWLAARLRQDESNGQSGYDSLRFRVLLDGLHAIYPGTYDKQR